MKKLFTILFSFVLVLSLSFTVHAEQELLPLIASGYTEDGIYYEIRGEISLSRSNSQFVSREVTYEGKVSPPRQTFWRESISGTAYTGTLTLVYSRYINNKTIAIYEGTLTAQ